ncbi:MAG: hypothetical protein KY476_05195 [Planctomycetes bacterium]|nr:hypothetical protein [Planctomycetota bacterium]
MDALLYKYDVNDATWFYLSALLIVAVYFRFNRLWSLRNLDLALLLSIAPGFLFLKTRPAVGNVWLFSLSGLLLIRLFCDPLFTRRPRMEQNLNRPGLVFLGIAAFAFLMTAVVTRPVPQSAEETARQGGRIRKGGEMVAPSSPPGEKVSAAAGPASSLLSAPVDGLVETFAAGNGGGRNSSLELATITARVMAILAHAAVIAGLFVLGYRHFGDAGLGIAMGSLYLLLPSTAYKAGEVNHVLPAALVVWALVAWRRPMLAGTFLGLACGTIMFPLFLLPLWAMFYGRKDAFRFGAALAMTATVLMGGVLLVSNSPDSFVRQTFGWVNWQALEFEAGREAGFWSTHNAAYRIPVFAAYCVMLVMLTIWPRRKSLEHLIAHSAALIAGALFWYPQEGGVYFLWYLPMLLAVVFRPRLNLVLPEPTMESAAVPIRAVPPPPRRELVGTASGGRFLR